MTLKIIEHTEGYSKSKRNLLFVCSLITITAIAASQQISIPGFSESLTMTRGVAMTLLLIALAFFAWEYYDEYKGAASRYAPIRADNTDVGVQARLEEHIALISGVDEVLKDVSQPLVSVRDFFQTLPERWDESRELLKSELAASIDHRQDVIKSVIEALFLEFKEEVIRRIAEVIVNRPLLAGNNYEQAILDVTGAINHTNIFQSVEAINVKNLGNLYARLSDFDASAQWFHAQENRLQSIQNSAQLVADEVLLRIENGIKNEIAATEGLQKSLRGLSKAILRDHRFGFQIRDKWAVMIFFAFSFTLCVLNIYGALRTGRYWLS